MALAPLGDLAVQRARLRSASGSGTDARPLDTTDARYGDANRTVGDRGWEPTGERRAYGSPTTWSAANSGPLGSWTKRSTTDAAPTVPACAHQRRRNNGARAPCKIQQAQCRRRPARSKFSHENIGARNGGP